MSYLISGGRKLEGAFTAHGAKNAALPILAASLLCRDCTIENCPRLTDTEAAAAILRHLGCETRRTGDAVHITAGEKGCADIPDELMSAMRSSIVFLGGMLGRCRQVTFTAPGGCELGRRPIDYHLAALRAMGAQVREEDGRLYCDAPGGLCGAEVTLPYPSVGATENILIAASTAKGKTVLRGAACEPEIGDLIAFLCAAGADITRRIDGTLEICGVETLDGCRHRVMPDRIEAATYLCAAAVTGGRAEAKAVVPADLMPALACLDRAGCDIILGTDSVRLYAPERLNAFGSITTRPHPGFPTDLQPVFLAAAATAQGRTTVTETIFDGRFRHVAELQRMGAQIICRGNTATVDGSRLTGAQLCCTDLRAGAALAVAALSAQGVSTLDGLHHIRRGYQDFDAVLRSLGADIREI